MDKEGRYNNLYRVNSTRYPHWDYSQSGFYFVTICTKNKIHYFGDVVDGEMRFSEIGLVANKFWQDITFYHPYVDLDEYIVMPNHVHGIINIYHNRRDAIHCVSTNKSINQDAKYRVSTDERNDRDAKYRVSTDERNDRDAKYRVSTDGYYKNVFGRQSMNLPSIIRGYKSGVTNYAKLNNIEFVWQPRFYDRIIRNEKEYNRIVSYILQNPERWEFENNNTANLYI